MEGNDRKTVAIESWKKGLLDVIQKLEEDLRQREERIEKKRRVVETGAAYVLGGKKAGRGNDGWCIAHVDGQKGEIESRVQLVERDDGRCGVVVTVFVPYLGTGGGRVDPMPDDGGMEGDTTGEGARVATARTTETGHYQQRQQQQQYKYQQQQQQYKYQLQQQQQHEQQHKTIVSWMQEEALIDATVMLVPVACTDTASCHRNRGMMETWMLEQLGQEWEKDVLGEDNGRQGVRLTVTCALDMPVGIGFDSMADVVVMCSKVNSSDTYPMCDAHRESMVQQRQQDCVFIHAGDVDVRTVALVKAACRGDMLPNYGLNSSRWRYGIEIPLSWDECQGVIEIHGDLEHIGGFEAFQLMVEQSVLVEQYMFMSYPLDFVKLYDTYPKPSVELLSAWSHVQYPAYVLLGQSTMQGKECTTLNVCSSMEIIILAKNKEIISQLMYSLRSSINDQWNVDVAHSKLIFLQSCAWDVVSRGTLWHSLRKQCADARSSMKREIQGWLELLEPDTGKRESTHQVDQSHDLLRRMEKSDIQVGTALLSQRELTSELYMT